MSSVRAGISLAIVVASLVLGWWLNRRGTLNAPRTAALVEVVVKYLAPFVLCFALWRLELRQGNQWMLPVLGVVISASMLLPAWLYATPRRFTRPQIGSFLTCAFFSNVGYLGAFTAFALYGEEAYGLCVLYFLFFSPCFFTLGFGIASRYGHRADRGMPRPGFADELRLYPFLGMLAGLLLNVLGIPRPEVLGAINLVLIPVETALYLMAIGSQLMFAPFRRWLGPSLVMSGIKFLYAPVIAWLLVTLIGLQGLPRFVVLLEASIPVAVSPLVLPLLFGLHREFSNALWLFTTLLAIPWLLFIIPVLQRL